MFSPFAFSSEVDCEKAFTTIDINYCLGLELEAAEKEMQRYLTKSLEHQNHDQELVQSIQQAQKLWEKYAEAHCDSVYTMWRGGTIRGAMAITCQMSLTQKRTHELWSQYLTYMDSTEPVLLEPQI